MKYLQVVLGGGRTAHWQNGNSDQCFLHKYQWNFVKEIVADMLMNSALLIMSRMSHGKQVQLFDASIPSSHFPVSMFLIMLRTSKMAEIHRGE